MDEASGNGWRTRRGWTDSLLRQAQVTFASGSKAKTRFHLRYPDTMTHKRRQGRIQL